jgi:hypothetical protein
MTTMVIRYHPKGAETAKILRDEVLNGRYGVTSCELHNYELPPTRTILGRPRIYDYALNYGFTDTPSPFALMNKREQAEEVTRRGIMPNTLLNVEQIEQLMETKWWTNVVLKNNTRITLIKNVKARDLDSGVYKYIPHKSEWRINYSFGRINNVFRKQLNGLPLGNAASLTPETDGVIRETLIGFTRRIAELASLQNFGLDILRDDDTGIYYFLELNKANALTVNTAPFFIRGFFDNVSR